MDESKILSNSWGSELYDPLLEEAIANAVAEGLIVVAVEKRMRFN